MCSHFTAKLSGLKKISGNDTTLPALLQFIHLQIAYCADTFLRDYFLNFFLPQGGWKFPESPSPSATPLVVKPAVK